MAKTHHRVASVSLLLLVLIWAGVGLTIAGSGDCLQACSEQYAEDLGVCAETYQQSLADASADRSACFAQATGLMDYVRCNAYYESARHHAYVDKVVCEHEAQGSALQCAADCQQSPASP